MKRILHIVKQQVTPVRDSTTLTLILLLIDMIWWKTFPKESRMLFEFKESSDIEHFTLHSDKPFGGVYLVLQIIIRPFRMFIKYCRR